MSPAIDGIIAFAVIVILLLAIRPLMLRAADRHRERRLAPRQPRPDHARRLGRTEHEEVSRDEDREYPGI